ncbi:MAG: [protein-PII] uridylyltransferase [Pyrinomonadaceae bacterium]
MTELAPTYLVRSHREKVLAQADACLKLTGPPSDPVAVAQSLRKFLKIEDRRLQIGHEIGASGLATAMARSFVLDIVVEHAYQQTARTFHPVPSATGAQLPCAVVAIGGYGRGELAPFSDLDLLFLYSGSRLDQLKPMFARVLQLLWDAGLVVGHTLRTVGDCINASVDDTHLRTALIDTRFLAGNKGLHNSLQGALEKDRRRRVDPLLAAIDQERAGRYAKFGTTVCLQEPNVKETAGGLRDYHTALWLAYARHGYHTLDELRAHDLVAEDEARRISHAYEFVWRVRNAMHFQARRKTERLAQDLQPVLADQFGYETTEYSLASEALMRDYYRQARELQLFSEALLARVTDGEPGAAHRWYRSSNAEAREPFAIRNGRLQFDGDPDMFRAKPLASFNAFALAQAARVPFGFRLRDLLSHNLRAITPAIRDSNEVTQAFFNLLRRRGRAGYVLRLMHDTGFLARLMPEFGRINLLVQHDLYHHYTVDEHTLRAIETLDDLHVSGDRPRAHLRGVFEEVKDPVLLYLALLMHDLGKGRGRGHVTRGAKMAARICGRLGLSENDTATVAQLVKLHVAMAHLALRRDLNEPRLIADFAESVGSVEALDLLLLLTYGDLNAVGPGVWTEWKGNLLWDLYRRTRKHMTGVEVPADEDAELVQFKEQVAAALDPPRPFSEVERHLALLPDRYRRINSPEAAALHMHLIENSWSDQFAVNWQRQGPASTKLTVVAPDRPGLFADLAGTLAAHGIEILSAELNTREDGRAIDEFMLRQAATRLAVEEHRVQKLERVLGQAVAGEVEVVALIERWSTRNAPRRRAAPIPPRRRDLPRVIYDQDASLSSTLIEVHAVDEPGLAYKIAHVLAGHGLEIVCARIATEKSDALDVFYVTDARGGKLSDEVASAAEQAILASLRPGETIPVVTDAAKLNGRESSEKSRSDRQTTFA